MLILCLYAVCCPAMGPYSPTLADPILESWRWKHEEALDDLSVLCMDEAPDGTLWFGCIGSLVHYDGVKTTRIPFDDELLACITHQKKIPWANALKILPDGSPLVLIGNSLVLRTNGAWRVLIQDAGPSVFTAELKQTGDGSFWLMTPGSLWWIRRDLAEQKKIMTAADSGFLGSIAPAPEGYVWIVEKHPSQRARLIRIPVANGIPQPESEWREYPVPFETDATEIRIAYSTEGQIFYADNSTETSIATFDPVRSEWTSREQTPVAMRFFSLSQGLDGTVWAGGERKLLRIPLNGSPAAYTGEQLPVPQVPLSLTETADHRLWVIGRIGYVYSIDIGTHEWMTYNRLHFQGETAAGTAWFLEKRGDVAVSYEPNSGKWRKYDLSDGLIDTVNVLYPSRHGLVWAAGSHAGRAAIAVFDGTRWSRFLHPEFAEWIEPRAVFEDADGIMWFGAGGARLSDVPYAGGVLQYGVNKQGGIQRIKLLSPSKIPYYVTSFAEAPNGTVWIGSTIPHLYDKTTNLVTQRPDELLGLNTVDMAFDQNGELWVAKEHAGIYRVQNNVWMLNSTRDGLAGVNLSDLLVLCDNTLLAASGAGISRFDGQVWVTTAFPESWVMSSRWSSMRQAKDGSLWFNFSDKESQTAQSIVNGAERFYTVRYRAETTPPDTEIGETLQRVAQPGNIHIVWSAQDPWSRTSRKELQYSWRLDGGAWSAFSHETGRTFLNLATGTHTLEVRARDRAFTIDPTPARTEFEVIPPVWQQAWFIALISILSGSIILLVRLQIRTREKHLIERQREREENLKELDRIKTGFFTNISHELRTPITVIAGRLELLLKSEADAQKQQALSGLLRTAHRMSALVTQLLDLRKIEEGKISVEISRGDLSAALKEWVSAIQVLFEKAQLTCTLHCDESCFGQFDFDKLNKIFTNLISNSIKYTKPGGTVQIRLQTESLSETAREIRFSVEDNGVGIPAEHLPHIFERFYRVPEASMAIGAGIGLHLTRELVDLLGGKIRAESPIHLDAERPGSRFTVQLPVERGTVEAVVSDLSDLSDRPDRTTNQTSDSADETPLILIVEDDVGIRDVICDGLKDAGRIITAENGRLGLQAAKERVPDLIITDVMMPEMDGIALCRELKNSLETSHIPVVMLTAKASVESQLCGLKTGADDYITKPFSVEILQVRVANLLESRRLLREKFSRDYATETKTTCIPENTLDREFIEKALQVLEKHHSNWEFSPEQFAEGLHMSLRSLQRKLKAVTDRSPKEFINEFRMKRAAERLLSTSDTIAEISFQVGMDEPTNFTRLFKQHFEMTPSQYRAARQKSAPSAQ